MYLPIGLDIVKVNNANDQNKDDNTGDVATKDQQAADSTKKKPFVLKQSPKTVRGIPKQSRTRCLFAVTMSPHRVDRSIAPGRPEILQWT